MIEKEKYLQGLDIVKYVMAILIVSGHCNLFEEWSVSYEIWKHVTEIAVPSFFAISAYLFFSKLERHPEKSNEIFWHTFKRLLIFFAVWYILMLPYAWKHVLSYCNLNGFLYICVVGCAFWGYWFIKSLIVNTTIVFLLRGKKSLIITAILSSALYLFLGFDYEYGHISDMIHPYYSFYYHIYAFVFGALVARYKDRMTIWVSDWRVMSSIVFLVFLFGFIPTMNVISKWLYPLTVTLLALSMECNIKQETSKKLRVMSVLYYVMQFILIFGFNALFENANSIVRFATIMVALTLMSLTIIKLEGKEKLAWLKYTH